MRVTDLERAEQMVVRVDVRLVCLPGSRPTGNLQGAVTDVRLTTVRGTTAVTPPSAIGVGDQTVPFLQFGDLRMPELDIAKTVTAAGGTCPGTESLTVAPGGRVTYCFVVTNPSATTSPPRRGAVRRQPDHRRQPHPLGPDRRPDRPPVRAQRPRR